MKKGRQTSFPGQLSRGVVVYSFFFRSRYGRHAPSSLKQNRLSYDLPGHDISPKTRLAKTGISLYLLDYNLCMY